MGQYQKHFTLAEARATLPELRRRLLRIQDLLAELRAQSERTGEAAPIVVRGNGKGPLVTQAIGKGKEEAQSLIEQIAAQGIQIKDLERGLVDFPHFLRGDPEREVFLCWHLEKIRLTSGTTLTPDIPAVSRSDLELSEQIKAKARELGFSLCGITSAEPPPHHREYARWLTQGRAGEMLYLHRQEPKRGNLDQVLPGVRSVVCVALDYAGPENSDIKEMQGVVARYARFDDYHETMWNRLEALLAFIQTQRPETLGKVYCDTGPITERDLAMRAGLGWIGKHTNLLSRRLGNWFFLGEVLLTASLPVDTPETTHCGTCTRCLAACPTGAITGPYELDARRCISYLTIELKGSIPEELRPLIGNRIYGCDDCLAACPWNKFAQASRDEAVRPRTDLTGPDLITLLELDDEGFRRMFARSPIKRTKRRGLLRNVCVALGNIGDARAIGPLRRAAEHDPEPLVREHAHWALTRIAEKQAGNILAFEERHEMAAGMPASHL